MTHENAVATMAVERYLLDEMSELERHTFEEHFFDCGECAEEMRLGNLLRHDARAVFPDRAPGRVLRTDEFSPRRRPMWVPPLKVAMPWAAAAVLALALTYQVRGPGTASFGEDGVQALTTVSLRPASRGPVPTVTLPDSGSVALALDVNAGTPGDSLTYRLAREDGAVIASGAGTIPAAGTPLLLLVPAERLRAGGQFVLNVISGDNTAAPPAEYRFNTAAR
jgi:hypothetical protein